MQISMKIARLLWLLCAVVLIGCQAALPDISRVREASRADEQPPVVMGPRGEPHPQKSSGRLSRIQQETGSEELIQANISLMQSLGGPALTAGNQVTLLVDGPATFASMSKAILAAQDHVNIETFIFDDDEIGQHFADLLIRKRAEKVKINLIYDSVGCMRTPSTFFQRLKDAGINVLEFNPINPLKARKAQLDTSRDHRKLIIVDGKVAFTGGVNLSAVYSEGRSLRSSPDKGVQKSWRDTHVRIAGPAVAQFQKLFLQTWKDQKGPELPEGDYFPQPKLEGHAYVEVIGSTPGDLKRLTYFMYVSAIKHAKSFVHLTTSYFVPDRQFMETAAKAARSGVDVKLIVPGTSDSNLAFYAGRSHYEDLLESGVRLYERQTRMLHAKTGVIDGVWSTVGSTNLDQLSFLKNNEINAIIVDTGFAEAMEGLFNKDISASEEITRQAWSQRPLWDRIKERFSRLFSLLL
jgi:cardiolipin synthase A/B